MKSMLAYFLVVGVPGLFFVIAGVLNDEYPVVALGGVLVIGSAYGLSRKHVAMLGSAQRRSFVLAGIIGASFAIAGFIEHSYLLATAGTVVSIGALLRLYGKA
jgi:hypothetical protein